VVQWLGLNTYGGLLLVYLGGVLGANTWLTKGYFDAIPRDLDEAAKVDGASHWQIFSIIMLPLVKPILVVVGLLTFIGTYSEYVLAKVLLTDKYMYTLAVGLNAMVSNQFAQNWGVFSAGALLAAIPTLLLFLIFQKHLVGGLTAGSFK
jgi:arabinogalactan oligomer/maltooligosaccharide transport system permease protein